MEIFYIKASFRCLIKIYEPDSNLTSIPQKKIAILRIWIDKEKLFYFLYKL